LKRVWAGRLLLFFAPLLVAAAISELWLRAQVGISSVTPFERSDMNGVAHELRPNFKTLYKGHEVETNSYGFRDSDVDSWDPDSYRLALTGDSFTFGNGISADSTLPALLESRLRKNVADVQVLNCGVPGYNAPNVQQLLQHRVLPLKPDFVVYVFMPNDVEPSRLPADIPADATIDSFHNFPLGSALLQWGGVRVKQTLRKMGAASTSGSIAKVARSFHEGGRQRVSLALSAMKQLCLEHEIPFAVATYPFLATPNPYTEIDNWVLAYCKAHKIPTINLREAYPPEEDLSNYWTNIFDPHPNRASNLLVANYMAEQLDQDLLKQTADQ